MKWPNKFDQSKTKPDDVWVVPFSLQDMRMRFTSIATEAIEIQASFRRGARVGFFFVALIGFVGKFWFRVELV
jgi:hypothetical protein